MYYCLSRYYVPDWCRWLNADSITYLDPENINGVNLFVYCQNNPIMYGDNSGHIPMWAKWLVGGVILATSIALTIATGGAAAGTIAASVHTIATSAMIGGLTSAVVGTAAGGITFNGENFGWNWDNAATGFMLGSITGTISGIVGGSLDVKGISADSWISRGVMAGVDSILGLGSYFAQNGINHTMDNISFWGAAISFAGGLFDFCEPISNWFDAFWSPAMSSEIGWGYDVLRVGFEKRKQKIIKSF